MTTVTVWISSEHTGNAPTDIGTIEGVSSPRDIAEGLIDAGAQILDRLDNLEREADSE